LFLVAIDGSEDRSRDVRKITQRAGPEAASIALEFSALLEVVTYTDGIFNADRR
jgi:hypothetical protein